MIPPNETRGNLTRSGNVRVLMYSAYFFPEYSGAALQALTLARQLRRQGHYIEFMTNRWPGLSETDIVDGFRVHRVEVGRGARHKEVALWLSMLRYVWRRRQDFDILHSHGAYYVNSIVALLAHLTGMKSLAKASLARDDLHGIGISLVGRIHRFLLRRVNACIAISRDLQREFIDSGIKPNRVHYLPNGVDAEAFCPLDDSQKTALRSSLGLPSDRPVFLYVGVMDRRKNVAWLADKWIENDGFETSALLLAVGPQSRDDPEGLLIGKLRSLADKFPGTFSIRNFESDIQRYYKAADLLILPSYKEGLPNVVLEAMSSGLACVAARSSGTSELVKDGITGYTYTPDDCQDFERALKECLSLGLHTLGERARKHILDRYSIEKVAERYTEIYSRLTMQHGPW